MPEASWSPSWAHVHARLKKVAHRTPKERHKSAQECPKGGPNRPKPFPKDVQDPPKSHFYDFFEVFLFTLNLHRFFVDLLLIFR